VSCFCFLGFLVVVSRLHVDFTIFYITNILTCIEGESCRPPSCMYGSYRYTLGNGTVRFYVLSIGTVLMLPKCIHTVCCLQSDVYSRLIRLSLSLTFCHWASFVYNIKFFAYSLLFNHVFLLQAWECSPAG